MTLAALRYDDTAFDAAFADFTTIREADFETDGQSDLLCRLVRVLAAAAAGATLDVEKDNRDRAERFLEDWIQELLDTAGGATA
jgi:hypothetical protein